MVVTPLLPDSSALRLESVTVGRGLATIAVSSSRPDGACPICGQPAARVHSRYVRTLDDLSWQGTRVKIRWRTRKFFCDTPGCPQRIFTERIPQVACRYGRRTTRARDIVQCLALTLGGEPGSRVAKQLHVPMSGDTLLREARRAKCPLPERSCILGVDDWALRRGQNYGTLVVDLERHRPVALLPDRRWETFRDWLLQHPGVEVVSRDRADCYARGAAAGAPAAQQVVDRWHLLSNLREALKRTAEQFMGMIPQASREAAMTQSHPEVAPPPTVEAAPSVTRSPKQDSGHSLREIRRLRRLERYQHVQQLRREGKSQRSIARMLGLDRETVRRFCHAPEFPERAVRLRESHATPFWAELRQLWIDGCQNARILTKKIASLGYRGSYDSVRRLVAGWRREAKRRAGNQQGQVVKAPALSAKRVAWLMFLSPDDLEAKDRDLATRIQDLCPDLRLAAELAHDFVRLVKDRKVERLLLWIDKALAKNSPIALRRFARGLQSDLPTIVAALTLPWSNGQTEGQVNRLKLIKRQMYGRAKLDLLAQRFLWRPEDN